MQVLRGDRHEMGALSPESLRKSRGAQSVLTKRTRGCVADLYKLLVKGNKKQDHVMRGSIYVSDKG
jgi:hypothetical protein